MHSTRLTGLTADRPIGAMAAFGLLRRLDVAQTFGRALLSWEVPETCVAVLHTAEECSDDEIVSALAVLARGCPKAPYVRWRKAGQADGALHDDIKMSPDVFRSHLLQAIGERDTLGAEYLDYLSAFGSEVTTAPSTGDVKPTAFHMTAGQQQFIKSVRELAESLDPDSVTGKRQKPEQRLDEVKGAFREALFGPWRYNDDQHALGWDPQAEALYAFSARAPTRAGPSSVRAAVWLAFESLPLFPTVAIGARLMTAGFTRAGDSFSWAVWEHPISVNVLRSLLLLPDLVHDSPLSKQLRDIGVAAIFRSRRDTDAKGRGQFRPAILCARGG